MTRSNLISKNVKSCGCQRKLEYGESSFNVLFYRYKRNAKKKQISFELKKEEFKKLTQKDCYYCGVSPNYKTREKSRNGDYIYNGIDRVDSEIGYTKENCVTCCGICNYAKIDMSVVDFYKWIKNLNSNFLSLEDKLLKDKRLSVGDVGDKK